ncbi:hypothetical protein QM325_24580 [Pseudomonas putida]|nr:hypothetical protein [Pseudomonas putida]
MKRILVSVKLQKYVPQQRPFDVLVFATKTPGIERDAFVAIFTAVMPIPRECIARPSSCRMSIRIPFYKNAERHENIPLIRQIIARPLRDSDREISQKAFQHLTPSSSLSPIV